jgi:hypothetical protein
MDLTIIFNELTCIIRVPQCLEYRFVVISIVFADDRFQMACSFFAVVPWNLGIDEDILRKIEPQS